MRSCSLHRCSGKGPPYRVSQPSPSPPVAWPSTLCTCFLAGGGPGPGLWPGATGAGPQASMSLLYKEGGDSWAAAGLVDYLVLSRKSHSQSPAFLREVTEAEEGPARVCFQRQGMGLLCFSDVHHPALLLLALPNSPGPQHANGFCFLSQALGRGLSLPMDPEHRCTLMGEWQHPPCRVRPVLGEGGRSCTSAQVSQAGAGGTFQTLHSDYKALVLPPRLFFSFLWLCEPSVVGPAYHSFT